MNNREESHNNCSNLLEKFINSINKLSTEENKKEFEQFVTIVIAALNEICYYELDRDSRFELILENLEKFTEEIQKRE